MATKKGSYFGAVFLMTGGAFFTFVAGWYLQSVHSHGWTNVWQPGSVGLLMLVSGALDLWWRARKR